MARKLSFLLSLAFLTVGAVFFVMSGAPQIGVAGQPPEKPHVPGDEVLGGVINTNEDVKVEIPLSANHNDGTIGCTELTFDTSDDTNGSVGAITDRDCNTTELARSLTTSQFYDPTASEDGAGAGTCSDGIDNDTATVPDGLIDADDPDCLVDNVIPVVSIGGLNKGVEGVIEIGDELINFVHTHPAGHVDCGGDGTKDSSFPCLHGITRGAFKTTVAVHSAGDTVIFRSELGDVAADDNLDGGITATSPDKGEALVINSSVGFPASEGVVMVDDELIIYRATKTGQLQDIIRGALGSTAAVHADDAHVFLLEPGFYGTLVEEIDSVQTILRINTLTGYGLNGGIVEVENEVILYDQTGSTNAECEGAAPCLLGLTRSAFGTTSKLHEVGRTVFTAAGDDIDQATANFTPRNEFNDDQKNLSATVRDDTAVDVDATSTTIPVDPPTKASTATMAELGFDASGGILTIQGGGEAGDEVVTYDAIGTVDADCAPYDAPCFTGVTRSVTNLTAINPVDGDGVVQVSKSGGAGFLYTVGKDDLTSPAVLVVVQVNEVNDAPEFKAGAKQTAVLEQGSIIGGLKETNPNTNILVTANDIDNCDLTFTITSIPSSGSVWVAGVDKSVVDPLAVDDVIPGGNVCGEPGDNLPYTDKTPNTASIKLSYVQNSTYDGSDSFTVEVTDNEAGAVGDKNEKGLDTLTVNITNSAPTAGPVAKVELPKNGTRTILLTASDADLGHCELNFIIKTHPTHGNVTGFSNNECRPGDPNTDSATIVYVPDEGYNGPDQFTYQVFDRTGKGLYDPNLGDGHNRTSFEIEINVGGVVPPGVKFGDVNCDTVVDPLDALQILLSSAGLQTAQEPGCPEIGAQ